MYRYTAAGHYADKSEREARAEAERRRDACRRAAAWAQAQSKLAGSKALGGMDDPFGGDPAAGLENFSGAGGKSAGGGAGGGKSGGGGEQHRAARHAQQAELARETVVGLCVPLHDAHWSATCHEPMTRDLVSSPSNRCCCLWCRPSPPEKVLLENNVYTYVEEGSV